jgi:hypothetical protein
MRPEHYILCPISSNHPTDETIHRGFVDAVRQKPDSAANDFWSQGHAYPRPADKTSNSQPSHSDFAAVGGFAHA